MDDLDIRSYRLLKRLYRKNDYVEIDSNKREFHCIFRYVRREYLSIDPEGYPNYTDRYIINDDGKTYILKRRSATRSKWIPYIVTTLVAVAALVISVIALLKQ